MFEPDRLLDSYDLLSRRLSETTTASYSIPFSRIVLPDASAGRFNVPYSLSFMSFAVDLLNDPKRLKLDS